MQNPTRTEILQWAWTGNKWPSPDWDFDVTLNPDNDTLIVDLASDKTCPTCVFFLQALYSFAGSFFAHYRHVPSVKASLERMLEQVSDQAPADVRLWKSRVLSIISGELEFHSPFWIFGGDTWTETEDCPGPSPLVPSRTEKKPGLPADR